MTGFEIFAFGVFAACVIAILIYGSKQFDNINKDIIKLKDHVDTIEHVVRYEIKHTGEHAGNRISALEKTVKDNYFKVNETIQTQLSPQDKVVEAIHSSMNPWVKLSKKQQMERIGYFVDNGAEIVSSRYGELVISHNGVKYIFEGSNPFTRADKEESL